MKKIVPMQDLWKQYLLLKKDINTSIKNVIKDQAFVGGSYVEKFEKELAKYFGVKYVIGLNSGTDALLLALWALGVEKGDEVITSTFSFIATPAAIYLLGAKPIFVDIDPLTFNLDPKEVEKKITKKTKAILPVHLYGLLSDMIAINRIAKKYNLFVVEDACQALGATFKEKKAGVVSDIGCLSFHPSKSLGAYGDAGALITNSKIVAEKVRILRNHGSSIKYDNKVVGISSRLDGLQAAVLSVKLKKLNTWNKKRKIIASIYNKSIKNINIIELPTEMSSYTHVYNSYTIKVKNGKRDSLKAYLEKYGIETSIFYPTPLHLQDALKHLDHKKGDFPIAERISKEVLSLPIYPEMDKKQINTIIKALNSFN